MTEYRYRAEIDFMARLTERLYAFYSLEHAPSVFRNRRASCYRRSTPIQIVYGYSNVEYSFEVGFLEYPTVVWVWPTRTVAGREGLYRIVLHEFAHVLQDERGGLKRGDLHGPSFSDALVEVQGFYPWDMARGV
jgi:hypothetical protein